jgi:hypothetical protein
MRCLCTLTSDYLCQHWSCIYMNISINEGWKRGKNFETLFGVSVQLSIIVIREMSV